MIDFDFRPATPGDFGFLFSLKKNAEYEAIKAVFGWDEEVQQRIHHEEWQEDQPTIVTVGGQPAGSFLLQDKGEHLYFCRFFLLARYHGKGMGSKILQYCIELADANVSRSNCVIYKEIVWAVFINASGSNSRPKTTLLST